MVELLLSSCVDSWMFEKFLNKKFDYEKKCLSYNFHSMDPMISIFCQKMLSKILKIKMISFIKKNPI